MYTIYLQAMDFDAQCSATIRLIDDNPHSFHTDIDFWGTNQSYEMYNYFQCPNILKQENKLHLKMIKLISLESNQTTWLKQ